MSAPMADIIIPASNLEAEHGLLGEMILSTAACEYVIPRLEVDNFDGEWNREIYTAIRVVHGRGERGEGGDGVGLVALAYELRKTVVAGTGTTLFDAVGGKAKLALLVEQACLEVHTQKFVRIVEEAATLRRAQQGAQQILEALRKPNVTVDAVAPYIWDLERLLDSANSANRDTRSWEEPTPLQGATAVPSFPMEALPEWLRLYVQGRATEMQVPPDLVAMVALGTVAAACARRAEVRVRGTWREPLNLYLIPVMEPGNKKSPVFADAVAPIEEYEQREAARFAQDIRAAASERRIAEHRLERAEKLAASSDDPVKQKKAEAEAREYALRLSKMDVPVAPNVYRDDVTPEELEKLIAEHGGRMAVMSAEGHIFSVMAGRYSNGVSNFTVFLKGHSGDTIKVNRVGRPPVDVIGPALTLCCTIQPGVLLGLMLNQEFRERGLHARIFYSLPISMMGQRDVDAPAMPNEVRAAYREKVGSLLGMDAGRDADGKPTPHTLALDDEAAATFLDFERALEPKLARTGELGHMTDWAGKLAGGTARVAGLLHLAGRAGKKEPWATPITGRTMGDAIAIAGYLVAHAKAAYAAMGSDPALGQALFLLEWLSKNREWLTKEDGEVSFTVRALFERVKGRFKTVAALEPSLAVLVEHGWIRRRPDQGRGPGRRSTTYDVHPSVLSAHPGSHYSQNEATGDGPASRPDSQYSQNVATAHSDGSQYSQNGGGNVSARVETPAGDAGAPHPKGCECDNCLPF